MSSSLARVALFVLAIVAIFVYLGEVLTELSGGGAAAITVGVGEVSAEAGERVFLGQGKCYTCHSVGEKGSAIRGPNLGDSGPLGMPMGLRAGQRAGERSASTGESYSGTDYLLESLIDPNVYVVEGFKAEMPEITRPPIALGVSEIAALVAYLQTLGGEGGEAPFESSRFFARVAAGAAEAGSGEPFRPYLEGDPANGQAIFFGEQTGCSKCHSVHGQGGVAGPDLTDIASTRSVPYIVESILIPGATVASGFERTVVTLLDWNEVIGLVQAETDEVVEIVDAAGDVISIPRDEIDEMIVEEGSPMPAIFADLLTVTELHDLLAYLLDPDPGETAADG